MKYLQNGTPQTFKLHCLFNIYLFDCIECLKSYQLFSFKMNFAISVAHANMLKVIGLILPPYFLFLMKLIHLIVINISVMRYVRKMKSWSLYFKSYMYTCILYGDPFNIISPEATPVELLEVVPEVCLCKHVLRKLSQTCTCLNTPFRCGEQEISHDFGYRECGCQELINKQFSVTTISTASQFSMTRISRSC